MPLENEASPQEGSVEQTIPEYSAVEVQAMELGWRPREEFQGDESLFIDAKEFVGRKSLYDKIETLKNENKTTKQAIEALKQHYSHVEQNAFNKAMKELKAEQNRAIADGDVEKYTQLEAEKEELESEKQAFIEATEKINTEAPQIHPELQSWINRNPWYNNQPHMKVFADQLGNRLAADVRAGSLTQKEALVKIEAAVKEEFPNKFRNPNKDRPSAVEATGKQTTPKSGGSVFKMSPEQEKVWKTLERSKVMTKEQYIADLKKMEN
jgi:hypothetical protein